MTFSKNYVGLILSIRLHVEGNVKLINYDS